MIFALKEANGGKLDSHLWFFNAFADQLKRGEQPTGSAQSATTR